MPMTTATSPFFSLTNKPSLESIKARLAQAEKDADDRNRRIDNCEVEWTDCALSIWAADTTLSKLKKELELAEQGWMATMQVLHLNGEPFKGPRWQGRCKFSHAQKDRILAAAGVWIDVPYPGAVSKKKADAASALGLEWKECQVPVHVASTKAAFVGGVIHHYTKADDFKIIAY